MDWQLISIGLRKRLGVSQSRISNIIGIGRRAYGRYESGHRTPIIGIQDRILELAKGSELDICETMNYGKEHLHEVAQREKSIPLILKESENLAELIGIILGDGEARKDGTIRISFDPKKDKNFLSRRIFPLIGNILGSKPGFESYKRIQFGNMGFVKFLTNYCGISPGNKFENGWEIPEWIIENRAYAQSVIRGIFDTDGYFGCSSESRSPEIMLGRFSERSYSFVISISRCFDKVGIKHSAQQSNDGRYKIRINSRGGTLKFFTLIGSSNIKHITRFLLWRLLRYNSRIEKVGISFLIKKTNEMINSDIENVKLPFLWAKSRLVPKDMIRNDENYLFGYNNRQNYKMKALMRDLIDAVGTTELSDSFGIRERSIRKWREGKRNPSYSYLANIFKVADKNGLSIEAYRVTHGKADD